MTVSFAVYDSSIVCSLLESVKGVPVCSVTLRFFATAGLSFSYHVMKLSLVARPYDSRRSTSPSPSRSAAWTDHASFAVRAFTTAWPAKLMLPPAPVYRSFSNHRNLFWFVETTRMSLSPSLFTSAARTPRAPSRSSTSTCLWKMISGKLGSHTLNCPATRAARQARAARAALTIIAARAA